MTKKRDYFWHLIIGFMIAVPVLNRLFWMMVGKLIQVLG